VSINYWMNPKNDPKTPLWPRNLHDCKTAVRWLRHNAKRYQIDTKHIGVLGSSAGGHLALMVAYTAGNKSLEPKGPYPGPDDVQAVVDLYGPTDLLKRYHVGEKYKDKKHKEWYASHLLPHPFKKVSAKLSLHHQAEARIGKANMPVWKFASPITHVKKGNPPTLIIHGTVDQLVDPDQPKTLKERLDANGVANEILWLKGAYHELSLDGTYQDGPWKTKEDGKPRTKDIRADVVAFFDKYLKPSR
jgi:acetyl esterase/lipase